MRYPARCTACRRCVVVAGDSSVSLSCLADGCLTSVVSITASASTPSLHVIVTRPLEFVRMVSAIERTLCLPGCAEAGAIAAVMKAAAARIAKCCFFISFLSKEASK